MSWQARLSAALHLREALKSSNRANGSRPELEVTETTTRCSARGRKRALEQNLELMRSSSRWGRKLAIGTERRPRCSARRCRPADGADADGAQRRDRPAYIKLAEQLGFPTKFNLKAELKCDAAYPLPPKIDWDNAQLVPDSLARWPEYQRQCLLQQQQDLMVEMARREYYPDYTLMGTYEAAFGMEDSYRFEVRVPLFLNKQERQDAALQEQYAQKGVIEDEAQAVAASYISRLESFQVELRMHGQLVDLLRGAAVPQARLALESNIAGFGASMMDFSDLIMAQQTLLDQELELEQNYIDILHTLTLLHVMTLGAFDPALHYVPTERPTVAAGMPVTVQVRATSTGVDVGFAITSRGGEFRGSTRRCSACRPLASSRTSACRRRALSPLNSRRLARPSRRAGPMSKRLNVTDEQALLSGTGPACRPELYVEPTPMTRRDSVGVSVALIALAVIGITGYVWLNPNLSMRSMQALGKREQSAAVVATTAAEDAHIDCPYCGMYADQSDTAVAVMWVGGGSNTLDSFDCVFNYMQENNVRLESGTVRSYETPGGDDWIELDRAVYLYDTAEIAGSMPPYVAAFKTEEQAEAGKKTLGGEVVDFAGLQAKWK